MKIGFVIDSLCDLPAKFIELYKIHVIPIKILNEYNVLHDYKTKVFTKQIYEMLEIEDKFSIETIESNEILNILNKIIIDNDYEKLFIITSGSKISKNYQKCLEILDTLKNHQNTTEIEVLNSKQISTGIGLLVEMLINHHSYNNKTKTFPIKETIDNIETIIVPNISNNLQTDDMKEEDSISIKNYFNNAINLKPLILIKKDESKVINNYMGINNAINKTIEILIENIKKQKIHRSIHISYGGSLSDFKKNEAYIELNEICKKENITVLKSNISGTLATKIGAMSLSVSFLNNQILKS